MKKLLATSLLASFLLLPACTSESDDSETTEESESNETTKMNLFKENDIEEGYWIGQSGNEVQDEDMIITNKIEYNPESDYTMNKTAYVTYYSGDEILSTVLHNETLPITVKTNKEADAIRISFDKTKVDNFSLSKQ